MSLNERPGAMNEAQLLQWVQDSAANDGDIPSET
jgi:hypothetical protein